MSFLLEITFILRTLYIQGDMKKRFPSLTDKYKQNVLQTGFVRQVCPRLSSEHVSHNIGLSTQAKD